MVMNKRFRELLRQGLQSIKVYEGKNLSVIQDELGYALGRNGGSPIEHWKRGHIPRDFTEFKSLVSLIAERGKLNSQWQEDIYKAAGFSFENSSHVRPVNQSDIETSANSGKNYDELPTADLSCLKTLLNHGEYHTATRQFFSSLSDLLQRHEPNELLDLKSNFDAFRHEPVPELHFIWGLLSSRLHQDADAIRYLQTARSRFWKSNNIDDYVRSCLELAEVYQRMDDFQTVQRYISEIETVENLIKDTNVQIQCWICIGQVCHDIGRLQDTVIYFEKALKALTDLSNRQDTELRILHLQTIAYRQLGQYSEAATSLRIARQIFEAANMPRIDYPKILNAEAHLEWYRGNLTEALVSATELVEVCDEVNLIRHRIYSRILLGNLYTVNHSYSQAHESYSVAQQLVASENYTFVYPWVFAQKSWLNLVQGKYQEALRLIWKAMEQADHGQRMSFNVTHSIIRLCQAEHAMSAEALEKSLLFYEESGDYLSCSVIRLYLAFIHIQQKCKEEAVGVIDKSLGWLSGKNILFCPNWWYPAILGQVLIFAIEQGCRRLFAERMFDRLWRTCPTHVQEDFKIKLKESESPSLYQIAQLLS